LKKKSKSHPPSANAQRFPAARPLTDQEVAEAIIRTPPPLRLIDKAEVLRRVSVTFPTIWKWMHQGNFPLSRNIGGKSAWLEHEVEAWIAARPANKFKSNADRPQQKMEA
jgi:predicted DNA-binding transcriptional regulator AlpA